VLVRREQHRPAQEFHGAAGGAGPDHGVLLDMADVEHLQLEIAEAAAGLVRADGRVGTADAGRGRRQVESPRHLVIAAGFDVDHLDEN